MQQSAEPVNITPLHKDSTKIMDLMLPLCSSRTLFLFSFPRFSMQRRSTSQYKILPSVKPRNSVLFCVTCKKQLAVTKPSLCARRAERWVENTGEVKDPAKRKSMEVNSSVGVTRSLAGIAHARGVLPPLSCRLIQGLLCLPQETYNATSDKVSH
mmetsp:Transcript_33870/g.79195  ORF Transcript_33870/g.79195 Transcript_33870/m.79195 type:complete len:155 (+) Transcript_33870:1813-2277(+)